MAGSVVTFYSYKGGVGRSFAVANIAVILAQWGSRVLVVDWDIEAPGLNHYFAPFTAQMPAGVLDFLSDCMRDQVHLWNRYTTEVKIPDLNGTLHIMPAAAGNGNDYAGLLQSLNWDVLYSEHSLGARLEDQRAGWLEHFDLVLVDSRTGVTDFSGLTTVQLPDTLAFMFTANGQSLYGCADIARRAMEARRRMPLDRPALLPLPIPARFEQREEYDRANDWRGRFATELAPFLEAWMPRGVDPLKLIDQLTIPYVPRWSFGEDLAAVIEPAGSAGTRTSSQAASYALETLAALLIQGFAKVDLLASSRDEYVHAARTLSQSKRSKEGGTAKIFLSYSKSDQDADLVVDRFRSALRAKFPDMSNIVYLDAGELEPGESILMRVPEIEQADAFVVIVGPSFSNSLWQPQETETILRQSLRSAQHKAIIPVVLKGGEKAFAGSRLADYVAVFVDPARGIDEQLTPVLARVGRLRS
jgi:cellulose biosynthesis protein BcsQ